MFALANMECHSYLSQCASNTIDALVTDPPAGIGFMGQEWDLPKGGRVHWVDWLSSIMAECLRMMKPGAHGLVWALPKQSHWTGTAIEEAGFEVRDIVHHITGQGFPHSKNLLGGLGTALKPSTEHWILCRKPLEKGLTVEANTQKWGTGALNIEVSRHNNRWPSNMTLEHTEQCVVVGKGKAGGYNLNRFVSGAKPFGGAVGETYESVAVPESEVDVYACVLGCPARELDNQEEKASRFFYCAKAAKKDRNLGLPPEMENKHPTVKSTELMRYLCGLITPKNGIVLDPFMGSGSTGVACVQLGLRFEGIELDTAYFDIAKQRIARTTKLD